VSPSDGEVIKISPEALARTFVLLKKKEVIRNNT